MKSCQETRINNVLRWKKTIKTTKDTWSRKRAIGLLLRTLMLTGEETFPCSLREVSKITGLSQGVLHKMYLNHRGREYRWIYHTGDKMFYYDGG